MKMPGRPWYPPSEPQTDIFGLHHISFLALQLPFCFEVGALSGSLVSPSPE